MKHASGFNIADDDDVEFYRSKETRRQKNAYKNCKQHKAESNLRDFSDLANLVQLVGHKCNLLDGFFKPFFAQILVISTFLQII